MASGDMVERGTLGLVVMRDHDPKPTIGTRFAMAGTAVKEISEQSGHVVEDQVRGRKTTGDWQCWRFWQGDSRGFGSWSTTFPARVNSVEQPAQPVTTPSDTEIARGATLNPGGAGIGTGPQGARAKARGDRQVGVLPLRTERLTPDSRYYEEPAALPWWLPTFPVRTLGVATAGTEERRQEDVFLHADPRIIVPGKHGQDVCATLFCDLEPENTISISPDDGSEPGRDEKFARVARSSTGFRVVKIPEDLGSIEHKPGCGVALQFATSEQCGMLGLGLTFAVLESSSKRTPVTTPSNEEIAGPYREPGGAVPAGERQYMMEPVAPQRPRAAKRGPLGIGILDWLGDGPMRLGAEQDKHQIGVNADGEKIQPQHISADAYFYMDREKDASLEFTRVPYPKTTDAQIPVKVRLSYDPSQTHPFKARGGSAQGLFRWWSTTSVLTTGPRRPTTDAPPPEPPKQPPITPPDDPPAPPEPPTTPDEPGAPTTPAPPPTTPPTTPPPPTFPGFDDQLGHEGRMPTDQGRPGPFGGSPAPRQSRTTLDGNIARTDADYMSATFLQYGFLGQVWRAQVFAAGETDMRYSLDVGLPAIERANETFPGVMRVEAVARQAGDIPLYTAIDGAARVRGGTAPGVVQVMPPEIDIEGLDEYERQNAAFGGIPVSSSFFAFGDRAWPALGHADRTTATGLKDLAWSLVRDPSDAERPIILQQQVSGAWVEAMRATVSSTGPRLKVPGAMQFSGVISPAQITANQNDYAPAGHAAAHTMRIDADAARDITGISGGTTGRQLLLLNVGAFTIKLKNASVSSTASNRFALDADTDIAAGTGILLAYDATSSRWRKAIPAASAGAPASSDLFSSIVSKTANYTILEADSGTMFDCDSSGAAFAMTLPLAPADKTWVGIMRRAGTPGANTVTVQVGGADVIRGPRSTAATSFALQLYESVILTYYATAGVWMAVAHSSTADAGTSIASLRTIGTGGTQACAGNDSRLSDSRAPTGSAGGELAGSYPNPTLSDEVWTAILLGV